MAKPSAHLPRRPSQPDPTEGSVMDDLDLSGEFAASSEADGHAHHEVDGPELEVSRSVARKTGWVPLDEWKRDPAKWEDAPAFLERLPDRMNRMRATREATAATIEATMAEIRERERQAAESHLEQAIDSGDKAAARQAATRLSQVAGPPPTVQAWVAERPWFNTHARAKALAVATAEEAAGQGKSVAQQLAAADREVQRVYPDLYGGDGFDEPSPSSQPGEARLSQVRRTHPAPHTGPSSGPARTPTKEENFKSLPPDAKMAWEKYFKPRGIDAEKYAGTFFAERRKKQAKRDMQSY
jgi:hypothetical protein